MLDWIRSWTRTRRARTSDALGAAEPITPSSAWAAGSPRPQPPAARTNTTNEHQPLPPVSMTAWLLRCPPPVDNAREAHQEQVVRQVLAQMIHRPTLPDALIPRASAVIPPLMRSLRQESPSQTDWVAKVSRDQLLTAEVLRLARTAHVRTREDVRSLEAALALIGQRGLQAAITRVVLKPILAAQGDSLAARASERGWRVSDAMGPSCAQRAHDRGMDWLDGFLAGTLWSMGRTAVLRSLDLTHTALPVPWSAGLDAHLDKCSHQLFGRLAIAWALGPALTEAARALAQAPTDTAQHPLALALLEAERDFLATHAHQANDATAQPAPQ